MLVAQESDTERQELGKRKDSFIEEPAMLGRRQSHVPKNQLPLVGQGQELLKGSFKGMWGGGSVQNSTGSPDHRLDTAHRWWSDQHHLDRFKYS